jgi:hypothetical protein
MVVQSPRLSSLQSAHVIFMILPFQGSLRFTSTVFFHVVI